MKALIIDDELQHATLLKALIQEHCPEISEAEIIENPRAAVGHLLHQSVDLLFLDVEMPGMDGFSLLENLPEEKVPRVIFTTGHQRYAMRAFEVEAIHYLMKPIDPDRLREAVARAQRQDKAFNAELLSAIQSISAQPKASELISLPDGASYHVVDPKDIIRVEGKGSYSTFFLVDGRSIMVSKRIRVYALKLDTEHFIKPHQSHLVNKLQVARFNKSDGGFLEMKDGSIVPVSAGLKSQVKAALGV